MTNASIRCLWAMWRVHHRDRSRSWEPAIDSETRTLLARARKRARHLRRAGARMAIGRCSRLANDRNGAPSGWNGYRTCPSPDRYRPALVSDLRNQYL